MSSPLELDDICKMLQVSIDTLGIVVVDHGSRREESNRALLDVVALFEGATEYKLVEPAHMELAEPSIATAFGRLVKSGAKFIVVHPYFLLPGRHWAQDIPKLATAAAKEHDEVRHIVTAPLGIHPLMADIMNDRIQHCMQHVSGMTSSCELCQEEGKCRDGLLGTTVPGRFHKRGLAPS